MKAAQEAVERARNGGGPTLLEGKTYYFRGHNEVDPNRGLSYRSVTRDWNPGRKNAPSGRSRRSCYRKAGERRPN